MLWLHMLTVHGAETLFVMDVHISATGATPAQKVSACHAGMCMTAPGTSHPLQQGRVRGLVAWAGVTTRILLVSVLGFQVVTLKQYVGSLGIADVSSELFYGLWLLALFTLSVGTSWHCP